MRYGLFLFLICGLCRVATCQPLEYDIVVYGATSAGVVAAVQARKMGKSVLLVGPDRHLGGLSSGGLGATDIGNKQAIGGLSREFYRRLGKHYGQPEAWTFEPHVAEKVFEDWVREHDVPVHRNEWLDRDRGVQKRDGALAQITMLNGNVYRAKMFIDASYEGDLMAAAGVSYTVGREAGEEYGESLNGVQTENAVHHQFDTAVDPYVRQGDSTSGLLPGIQATEPGPDSSGDRRVQAYCFRVCLTDAADNRVPFPRPTDYDALRYELLLRTIRANANQHPQGFFTTTAMPHQKTDTNNAGPFSTDNIGMNYAYPEADYATRREILKVHKTYQQGFFWFLANDPRVPAALRRETARWGLAKDEFLDNDHWPHQLYVREARRMVGAYVMTQHHCEGKVVVDDSVGMGAYNMDSHNVQRYVDRQGRVRNEGDVQVSVPGPYAIAYRALIPQPDQCTNLLVPVCLSSSHIAFGSIRMEPVFMVLGQSAATAASLAIDGNLAVQDVDYQQLRERLLADSQVLQ